MLSVKTNILAQNANRQLNATTNKRAKSTEKLSSGYKINRAADDAAGLGISEKMRRQIRGLTQGVQNTQEGVSVCQVADGALAEVNDMLHRITELSVKAANGTNTESDRRDIQREITQLLQEIDRIGDETQFNEQYIFRGVDIPMIGADGSGIAAGDIPFSDFTLADLELGYSPFREGSNAGYLQLQAIVSNPESAAYNTRYNLIFGSGGTSHPSIRLTYEGQTNDDPILLENLTPSNYRSGTDASGKSFWERDLIYENEDGVGIKITQRIAADDSGTTEKNYNISYAFENIGTVDVDMDFMFHVDTAYNNNDTCEGYFTNGNRIDRTCVFNNGAAGSRFTGDYDGEFLGNEIPESFSIVDVESALAFSEKISFLDGDKPDCLSIGSYGRIDDWDYYDNLRSNLGGSTTNRDLGFSLMWNIDMSAGSSRTVGFNYGIAATDNDANLAGVPVQKDRSEVAEHQSSRPMWIHSGVEPADGMWIELEEMNATVLGINRTDVSTVKGAEEALDSVKGALAQISRLRSNLGAQQNRLEHTIANEENIVENTTAAESQIRDTDIAKEMVEYANLNILAQAGVSMLTQANQQPNSILSLLQ